MPRKFQTGYAGSTIIDERLVEVTPRRAGSPGDPILVGDTRIGPNHVEPVKYTAPSREVYFDTLFDDFRLSVQAVYNFYEVGESDDESGREYDKLEDLPRYTLISWDRAPTLPRPKSEIKRPGKRIKENIRADVTVNGLQFDMSKVLDFSTVRRMTANGYLNVGVVGTRVSVPESGVPSGGAVDEELYLVSDELRGIPLNHLTSNDRLPRTSVVIDQLGTTAAASRPAHDPLATLRGQPPVATGVRKANVNLGAGVALGALEAVSSGDTREHLENVLELSAASTELGLLSALDDMTDERRLEEPKMQSPEGLPGLEYIGYVLEKQRLDDTGTFRTVEEIEVPDAGEFVYVDTRVAYGRVYRYRIRCVLRWTHPANTGPKGLDPTDPLDSRTAVRPIAPHVSHFLNSSWSDYGTVAVMDLQPPDPPEDLRLRTNSAEGTVEIVWRFPANPQRDISGFTLYRRSMRRDIFTSNWEEVASVRAANGRVIDSVPTFEGRDERWVYAMTSTSVHRERSPLSVQLSCRLNPHYRHEGEDEIRQVSQPGVPLEAHGALSVRPPRRDSGELIARRKVAVWPRPGISKFVNMDVDLVLRLESLDTGEVRDILLDLNHVGMEPTELPPPVPGRVPLDATVVEEVPDTRRPDRPAGTPRPPSTRLASPK